MPPLRTCTVVAAAAAALACGPDEVPPLPPGTFAFGVFGDGPYHGWEEGPYRRMLGDVGRADLAWLLHVGDLFWYPCSDEAYRERRAEMDAVPHAVVYTPGDNEWTDCHEERPGAYDPLERLARVREIFFTDPTHSLGSRPLPLVSQAADAAFAEFPENARWSRGGFVFATLHVVGSNNGLQVFPGYIHAYNEEADRRLAATLAWLDDTFERARETQAKGVVLVLHANVGLEREMGDESAFAPLVDRLEERVRAFPGLVVLIHGDSHQQRVDRPLLDDQGRPYANFVRVETFGSPDIGWVRVVLDTVAGRIAAVEPRLMRGWW